MMAKQKNTLASQYGDLTANISRRKLQMVIDQGNSGDRHLSAIAEELDEDVMADTLCPRWDIKHNYVKGVMKIHHNNPQRMR